MSFIIGGESQGTPIVSSEQVAEPRMTYEVSVDEWPHTITYCIAVHIN